MKNILKIMIVALIATITVSVSAIADNDKPINVTQLPAVAQQVIKSHFGGKKVALAKQESGIIDKKYDVVFTDGSKIEFDRKGQWTEIDCRKSAVPTKLVPAAITKQVKANYAGQTIVRIEKDRNEYEVKLSNGIEITFNGKFQVIDID